MGIAGRVSRWTLDRPLDLARTLGVLRHGGGPAGDPTTRFVAGAFWRASLTPEGPGRLMLRRDGSELTAHAWGPGAGWLLDGVEELVGRDDDWSGLDLSSHPVLHDVRRRLAGLRLCRSRLVLDSLVPAILEQRVTGGEAWRAWRDLVRNHGTPAPGPTEPAQWLAPDPAALLAVPTWDWHRYGVDRQRVSAIRAAATVASRLEECVAMTAAGAADGTGEGGAGEGGTGEGGTADGYAAATRRLQVLPGVGLWTAAETTLRALGDPDAVSVGDYHLKNRVGWVLTGAARTDDDTMLELLEPWRGQRARVVRLIELSGFTPPKYGPRFAPKDMRAL